MSRLHVVHRNHADKTIFQRAVSTVVSLAMVLALFPASSLADDGKTQTALPSSSIMNEDSVTPADWHEETENPYGARLGEPFMLSTQNELFMFTSWDTVGTNGYVKQSVMDRYDPGTIKSNTSSNNAINASEFTALGEHANAYPYMQAVAFDPYGTGRDDHVAYVAYDPTPQCAVLMVVNASTGALVDRYWLASESDSMSWLGGESSYHRQYEGLDYLSITAGRYSAQATGDSIVVYTAGRDSNAMLNEFVVQDGKIQSVGWSSSLLNPAYEVGSNSLVGDTMAAKLACDLATGDFNADGIDDLAVVSNMYRPSNATSFQMMSVIPYVSVAYGDETSGSVLSKASVSRYVYHDDGGNAHTITNPGIAAGDLDGDGYDEVVVAGMSSFTSYGEYGRVGGNQHNNKSKSRFSIMNADEGSLNTLYYGETDNNAWTKNGLLTDNGVFQKEQFDCVAINGRTSAEYLFYSGNLMALSGGELKAVFTPSYFVKEDGYIGSTSVEGAFIQSVAVGNFSGDDKGYEQVVFTLGLREATGSHDYYYKVGIIGGTDFADDGQGNYGPASSYYSNDLDSNYAVSNKGSAHNKRVNCLVVAVDNGNDGIMATYKGHGYVYSDPSVVAVLQAAPYFGELGGWDVFQGETAYRVTQSYTFGRTVGSDTSWAIGGTGEVSGPGAKIEIEACYTTSITQEFENSLTTSYFNEFKAGPYDSVVVCRTPFDVFSYTIEKDGTTETLSVQVPLGPTYYQLGTDEYNEFVDEFNTNLASSDLEDTDSLVLNKLDEEWLGQEGNPWGYATASDGAFTTHNPTLMQLSYNGGFTSSGYAKETSEQATITKSHGFNFSVALSAGGSGGIAEAWIGIKTSLDQGWSAGTYETNSIEQELTGTVSNIDANALSDETGHDASAIKRFGFTWRFGSWDVAITNGGTDNTAPVLGYALGSITAPVQTPDNLLAAREGTIITLTWQTPSASGQTGRLVPQSYNVYQVDDAGNYTRLNTEPIADTTYTLEDVEETGTYRFAVTSYHEERGESLYSNMAAVGDVIADQAIELTYNKDAGYVQWRYVGSATWTNLVPINAITGPAGADGTDGVDGREIELQTTETEVQWRYVGDEEWTTIVETDSLRGDDGRDAELTFEDDAIKWRLVGEEEWQTLASLEDLRGADGQDGTDGQDGADGREVELRVDGSYVQWRYKGDATWTNLIGTEALKGADGQDGTDGVDGKTPYIQDGYWYVGERNTGVRAYGLNGTNGSNGQNGSNGTNGANGQNGTTTIVTNVVGSSGNGGSSSNGTGGGNNTYGTSDTPSDAGTTSTTTADGSGVTYSADSTSGIRNISLNDAGELLFDMADGRVLNAGTVPAQTDVLIADLAGVKRTATLALAAACASLVWNAVNLAVLLKNRKQERDEAAA